MIDLTIHVSRIETRRGPIEFSVAGSGPPVLYFHGTPCSSRLAIEMEQQLVVDGFQLIVPQRPGYFGTPLGDRVTTADCAELAALVLDHLKIERVAAIGTSGGGPPVLAFALRYPARTAAVILQCAQTHRWDDSRWVPAGHRLLSQCFRWRVSRRLFCQIFPLLFRIRFSSAELYLRDLAGERFSALQNEPAAWQFASGVFEELKEFHHERDGYCNDLATWVGEDVLTTGQVDCPTLLLHDRQDPAAPFCHAEYAAAQIPAAEIVELVAGGHLIWFGRDAALMQQRRTAFLSQHLAADPTTQPPRLRAKKPTSQDRFRRAPTDRLDPDDLGPRA
jgi:pimeloyl-ACP methyl ester carboxylesterase